MVNGINGGKYGLGNRQTKHIFQSENHCRKPLRKTWLIGGLEHVFFYFPYIGKNHSNLRTHVFRGVGIPPTNDAHPNNALMMHSSQSIWHNVAIIPFKHGGQNPYIDDGWLFLQREVSYQVDYFDHQTCRYHVDKWFLADWWLVTMGVRPGLLGIGVTHSG